MNKSTSEYLRKETNLLNENLQQFVGEFNDDLTREHIRQTICDYLRQVEMIAPITIDYFKVGVDCVNFSGVYPWEHRTDEIVPNAYTRNLFSEIEGNIFP